MENPVFTATVNITVTLVVVFNVTEQAAKSASYKKSCKVVKNKPGIEPTINAENFMRYDASAN